MPSTPDRSPVPWLQPLDPYLSRGGVAHDGEVASRLGLPGIPSSAEIVALYTYLRLARQTGARLHITRLSSGESLDLIERARKDGVDVTCDVAAHHLHLCDMDIGYFNPHCHVVPPLRSQRDRIALSKALADGRINAICSDHTPVDDDAKQAPFSESEPGTTGLELLLPLTLKWAAEHKLPLVDALARITSEAAKIAGIAKGGHLSVGARADVCIFDPDAHQLIDRGMLRSQGKNTPFLGLELPGKVHFTLVEGTLMYEAGR